MNLSIGEIATACKGRLYMNKNEYTEDSLVDSVTLDSRKVVSGGVFVATVGNRVDGHSFIPLTFDAGAALVVTEKLPEQVHKECGAQPDAWGNYLLVEDSFQALKDMAEYYRGKINIPIVGITGSVGKTSTKEFVAAVLSQEYRVLKTEGNFNNEIGVPLTLLRIREEHEAAVVEMGISDFGEMHRLSRMVRPNICVITNIGQCHLENLKSREGILKAKTEIFDYMAEDGEVCLNGEDDMLRTVTQVKGKSTHFFGLGEYDCESVYASDICGKGLRGSDALIHMNSGNFRVKIPLPGKHMIINAAAAACVAELFGLSGEQIAEGISGVKPVGGRNNILELSEYTVIDDCYNANPVSMEAAIDLLAMADTFRVAILGDMFELGDDSDSMHERVGKYAAESGAEHIICVGENARHMYEGAIKIVGEANNIGKVFYFAELKDLMHTLETKRNELLPKGSTILIKASHGMKFNELIEKCL